MSKKLKTNSELDLIGLFITIWAGKKKIFLITIVAMLALFLQNNLQKKNSSSYTALTEILPITIYEESRYDRLNKYVLIENLQFSINKNMLLELFIAKLSELSFINNLVKKSNLVKRKDFTNEQEYNLAVEKIALSIELLPPNIDDLNMKNWQIKFKTNDLDNWKSFLYLLNESVNQYIQLYIREYFDSMILDAKENKEFKLQVNSFEITKSIQNYKKKMVNRIAFLNEQASIARKLDMAKNSIIESQSIITETTVLTRFDSKIPYFMRGYVMIEKEIELIESRTNINAFVDDLYVLEDQRQILLEDKSIDQFINRYQRTPINNSAVKFYAGKIDYKKTKYLIKQTVSDFKKLILVFLTSLILGSSYVIFEHAIKKKMKS